MRVPWLQIAAAAMLLGCSAARGQAQTQNAILESVHFSGTQFPESQILPETGLKAGGAVTKEQLQAAADRLAQLGLFSKVGYEFHTLADGLTLTFKVEDAKRVPVSFDNIPWFGDSELTDAIKQTAPFFDGTAPEGGGVLDRYADAVQKLLEMHKHNVTLEHELTVNPLGDGNVQVYRIQGESVAIATVEFSDPLAASSPAVQQQITELRGKHYSRLRIDLFLVEQVRPLYVSAGYLRVKLGPPEIRLTGNPNRPLPDSLGVFIPVVPGDVYHWLGAQWPEKTVISPEKLNGLLKLKAGDPANELAIRSGWEAVEEEYGRHGYVEAQVTAQPVLDDAAHTAFYKVVIQEGPQYHMGEMVLTGLSLSAERLIRLEWPIPEGRSFDKIQYEEFLVTLQEHRTKIFGQLPIHYDEVGHWLRTDASKGTVDVLLDFK